MTQELSSCPFCGAGETVIHVNHGTWTGRGYGEPVSVEVRHWCKEEPGQPSRAIIRVGRDEGSAIAAWNTRAPASSERQDAQDQPRLTVRLTSFPESNGKRNWTALLAREEKWGGLIGNAGGITVARGELWNRVAYESERARFLLGLRDTEPFILDYGDDIETPEQWAGETRLAAAIRGVQT